MIASLQHVYMSMSRDGRDCCFPDLCGPYCWLRVSTPKGPKLGFPAPGSPNSKFWVYEFPCLTATVTRKTLHQPRRGSGETLSQGFPKEGAPFTGLEFRAGPAKNPAEHET